MIHDKIAYWRYPQPADRQDEGGNEHRAWRLVRQLRVENARLLAERDWWRAACYRAAVVRATGGGVAVGGEQMTTESMKGGIVPFGYAIIDEVVERLAAMTDGERNRVAAKLARHDSAVADRLAGALLAAVLDRGGAPVPAAVQATAAHVAIATLQAGCIARDAHYEPGATDCAR